MPPEYGALAEAREALTRWIHGPGRAAARSIVVFGIDHRQRKLVIGVSQPLSKALQKELGKLLGDAPHSIVPAAFRRHTGPAGDLHLRPLEGGILITDWATQQQGTLGLVIHDALLGQRGFLTAGHVVDQPSALVGQPDNDNANIVGVVLANGFVDSPLNVDAAFVGLNDLVTATPYSVWQEGGSIVITSLTDLPLVDQACTLQGAVSGTESGEVRFIDFVLPRAPLPALVGLSLATYQAAAGDSGGPVFNAIEGGHEFLGLHTGEVDLDGETYSAFTQVSVIQRVVRIAPPS